MMKLSIHTYSTLLVVFYLLAATIVSALPAKAQQQQPQKCDFGNFEAKLPGIKSEAICDLITGNSPLLTYINAAVTYVTGIIVVIGIISILVGGYFYMTAGGSAERVGFAKTIIGSALAGIVIAMVGWLILNTVSPQFAEKVEEPKLILCKDDSECPKGKSCVTRTTGSKVCQ